MNDLIKTLHNRRLNIREQQKELLDRMEVNGYEAGEDKAKWENLDAEFVELGDRVNQLLTTEEHGKELDAQRERFEKVVRSGYEPSFGDGLSGGIVRAALAGEGPRSFVADFRNLKHEVLPDGRLKIGQHDLTKITDAAGKFTVPQDFVETLFRHLVENTAVRAAGAKQITTDTGQTMPVPKTLTHGAAAAVAEGVALAESDPTFGQASLGAWKFGQLIQVSNELATDTAVDLDGYLADQAGSNLGLASGNEYVFGDGSTEPDGVAVSPVVGKTGATGQTVTVLGDDLIDLFHSLVTGYRANGSWLMRDATFAFIRKIKTGVASSVEYLYQPGLIAGAPDTILGRPVFTDPGMPVMAANAYSILFGDFSRHYLIRDVQGVRFERSDDFAFDRDTITFRAILRTDGKRVDLNAVKAYRNSAT